jgi:hypothetical protein
LLFFLLVDSAPPLPPPPGGVKRYSRGKYINYRPAPDTYPHFSTIQTYIKIENSTILFGLARAVCKVYTIYVLDLLTAIAGFNLLFPENKRNFMRFHIYSVFQNLKIMVALARQNSFSACEPMHA